MKTGSKICLFAGVALVVGYAAGSIIGWPNTNGGLMSGDIGKVNKFNKEVASPEIKALQEKLMTDEEYRNEMILSYNLIDLHFDSFADLVKTTAEVTGDIPEFSEANKKFKSLETKAFNIEQLSEKTMKSLSKLIEGKDAPEYEQLSHNSMIAFMQIGESKTEIKGFVESADNFLKGKDLKQYKKFAFARDQWIAYLMYDAILNGADEEYAKWDMRGRILDNQSTADIIKIVDSDHQRIALSPSIFVAAYGNAGLQSKESALGIYLLESNSDCSNSYHDSFLKLAGSQVFSDDIKDDNLKCILD